MKKSRFSESQIVGILYTWARKARGFAEEPPPDDLKALQAEMTKLTVIPPYK